MDQQHMYGLFSAIDGHSANRRRNALEKFIKLNSDYALFEKLPLEASSWGRCGSMIPYMQERITYLTSLMPLLSSVKYLKHKRKIEQDIETWKNRIKSEEIRELLESLGLTFGCRRSWKRMLGRPACFSRVCQCGLFPLTENLCCTGRQHDFPSARAGFGIPGGQATTIFSINCAADFQCTADLVEVLPLESADFILCDDLYEHTQLPVRQNLFLSITELGCDNLFGGIAGDQVRFLRRLQRTVERGVDAANRAAGQTVAQLVIEPLDISRCEPGQLFIAQAGPDLAPWQLSMC